MAQSVERRIGSAEVTGPIPVSSLIKRMLESFKIKIPAFFMFIYGFNNSEMLIYTWCEGDTTLTLFNDRQKYEKESAAIEKWFNENC